ncbi:MAG TPA: flagellar basal body-associated FliL family protein [Pseudomonadales bacterium]
MAEANAGTDRKNLIVLAIAVLTAVAASIGGTLYFIGGADQDAGAQAPAHDKPAKAIYHSLRPPFLVNYVTGTKPRYLQAELTVMSRDPEVIRGLVNHMPLVRSQILTYLTDLDFYELQSEEGKEAAREGLRRLIDQVLRDNAGVEGVESVLFNNFVMQ